MNHTTSVQVTVAQRAGRAAHARAVMWGIDSAGHFGSQWSAELPLDLPLEATTRDALLATAWALIARLDGEVDARA